MRKLLALAIVAIMTSCAPKSIYSVRSFSVDYTEANKQGVFVTEAPSVSFEYDPVGSVQTIVSSGIEYKETGGMKVVDYDGNIVGGKGEWRTATFHDALDGLVKKTKQLGGNGIIGLIIDINDYGDVINVSGMAIKKK